MTHNLFCRYTVYTSLPHHRPYVEADSNPVGPQLKVVFKVRAVRPRFTLSRVKRCIL